MVDPRGITYSTSLITGKRCAERVCRLPTPTPTLAEPSLAERGCHPGKDLPFVRDEQPALIVPAFHRCRSIWDGMPPCLACPPPLKKPINVQPVRVRTPGCAPSNWLVVMPVMKPSIWAGIWWGVSSRGARTEGYSNRKALFCPSFSPCATDGDMPTDVRRGDSLPHQSSRCI